MSRHLDSFQMYETRTAEEARRRNKYAENQKNNELGTQKELERLHLETMKKERRRLEQELSKIRNKGQYMVKRPSNVSNQAVNFTLRHTGPMYGSKTNPALSSTWHGSPNYAKTTGAKRRLSKPEYESKPTPRERRTSRRKVSNGTQSKQPAIANGTPPTEKTATPEQNQQKQDTSSDSKESARQGDLSTESPITRVKEANITPRVQRNSIIIISETDETTPRKPTKNRKELSIFDMNISDARGSVAKRLLAQDDEPIDAKISSPRTASPKPAIATPPVTLESVPEEPPKAPPPVPPISSKAKPESNEKPKEGVKEKERGEDGKSKEMANPSTGSDDISKEPDQKATATPPAEVAKPEEGGGEEDVEETTAENRARDLKRVKQMLENPTQVFDQGKYAPDGGLRTIHLLPDPEDAFEEARKARYLRGKDVSGNETELSINEIFAKDQQQNLSQQKDDDEIEAGDSSSKGDESDNKSQ